MQRTWSRDQRLKRSMRLRWLIRMPCCIPVEVHDRNHNLTYSTYFFRIQMTWLQSLFITCTLRHRNNAHDIVWSLWCFYSSLSHISLWPTLTKIPWVTWAYMMVYVRRVNCTSVYTVAQVYNLLHCIYEYSAWSTWISGRLHFRSWTHIPCTSD